MLTKDNTLQIKGVAIVCMVFFHLCAFPERVPELTAGWIGSPLTKACQICVPIFLFLSGYGLQRLRASRETTMQTLLQRIRKLYTSFWWIAGPLILAGVAVGYYTWAPADIALTLLGITANYNHEWWFFSNYLELLVIFFCLGLVIQRMRKRMGLRLTLPRALTALTAVLLASRVCSVVLPLGDWGVAGRHINMVFVNLSIFLLGAIFARYALFTALARCAKGFFAKPWFIPLFLTIPFLTRAYLPLIGFTELVGVPMLCFGTANLCKYGGVISYVSWGDTR